MSSAVNKIFVQYAALISLLARLLQGLRAQVELALC